MNHHPGLLWPLTTGAFHYGLVTYDAVQTTLIINPTQHPMDRFNTLVTTQLKDMPKIRMSKAVQSLLSEIAQTDDNETLLEVSEAAIRWAEEQSLSIFSIRLRLECADLLIKMNRPASAIKLTEPLIAELKRKEVKAQLVRAYVAAARAYVSLKQTRRARASVLAGRAIKAQLPASLQSRLDHVSGAVSLVAGEFAGALGYFSEAHNSGLDCTALKSMVYIMLGQPKRVDAVVAEMAEGAGPLETAVRSLALAVTGRRDLRKFNNAADAVLAAPGCDPLIESCVTRLRTEFTDEHLVRVLRPYRRVELGELTRVTGLEEDQVIPKLSSMILEGTLDGVIDQASGCLLLGSVAGDATTALLAASLQAVRGMAQTVAVLQQRAESLSKVESTSAPTSGVPTPAPSPAQ
eukprot:gnl/Dysnectes_brevis/1990_a2290_1057.p1 GENE.gnl/Dysnectes_brevis/1990_a2290_1057~~gnl/Dysnectes_brevis/1990_a2290_1057.p1  ORF type:complete len:406 (-),score=147.92 gnl/Dysnectes_brevis/1990_a2290_1057:22-1239(-)